VVNTERQAYWPGFAVCTDKKFDVKPIKNKLIKNKQTIILSEIQL